MSPALPAWFYSWHSGASAPGLFLLHALPPRSSAVSFSPDIFVLSCSVLTSPLPSTFSELFNDEI